MNTTALFSDVSELANDPYVAKAYLKNRAAEAQKFTKSIRWSKKDKHTMKADVSGSVVIRELWTEQSDAFHKPLWGKLVLNESNSSEEEENSIKFHTFDNFVAYMLAQ